MDIVYSNWVIKMQLKIGDFSNLCHTSIKTIRYYDKIGLLSPSYVDPYTKYRYYDEGQIKEYYKIYILKEIGFTLKEIQNFKDRIKIEYILMKKKIMETELKKLLKQLERLDLLLNNKQLDYNSLMDVIETEKINHFDNIVKAQIGRVKWFNVQKGYGFIETLDEKDVFVHYSIIDMTGFKTLDTNQIVEFDYVETIKGLAAVTVHIRNSL